VPQSGVKSVRFYLTTTVFFDKEDYQEFIPQLKKLTGMRNVRISI
jgi:hypothetical protein